ncbi:MAG: allantoate amidohydrolase [Sphingobium sp.]
MATAGRDAEIVSRGQRAVERCRLLAHVPYSALATGLYRAWLTPAHRAALDRLTEWMRDAGLTVRQDAAGNLIGRLEGEGPALLIGSHIDSVRDAGAFDGPLGIMLGIECAASLHARGAHLPFPLEIIAFGDEEGSRFPASMLTSRAVAGTLEPGALMLVDGEGVCLEDALAQAGLSHRTFADAHRTDVLAYLEAHIEQGPVLEAEGLALGIVTAIAGQRRLAVTITGTPGHAGTNAMHLRRDALAAAAECVLAVEHIARAGRDDLVATVGQLTVAPGATNVVPGCVDFTVDVRAGDDSSRDAATASIVDSLNAIATAREVSISIAETQVLAASPCDPMLTDRLSAAVVATGQAPRRMVSGAGHDAMVMAACAPTAMLFIRCKGGVSHNPAEDVMDADAAQALKAMLHFIEGLAA